MSITFQIHPEATDRLNAEPDAVQDLALSCLDAHRRLLATRDRPLAVLKDSPESAVTLVDVPGLPQLCIKEFRWRGWLHSLKSFFRPSQGLRAFRNGGRLLSAGIAVAAPLVLVRETRWGVLRSEWILMEVIPGALELDRYLAVRLARRWTSREQTGFVELFGRYVGSMHANGIFHADLKTCNILVSEEQVPASVPIDKLGSLEQAGTSRTVTVRFFLLDYDEVRFFSRVPFKKRVKNLLQIFLSTPVGIGVTDRLRFLREYALHMGLTAGQRRKTENSVLEAARGRQILYVGVKGDVRETWEAATGQDEPLPR